MSGLHRTPLTTSQKIECAAMALAGQEAHGTITKLSQAYGISRPTVYVARDSAEQLLKQHFELPASAGVLVQVQVDEAQLVRAVIALRVIAPNAIRPIEDLLPILYPGLQVSYGKIQWLLSQAEERAQECNARVDLSGIQAGAVDEMFSQGAPVLAGVDLESGYLFGLELSETRAGQDWARHLEQAKQQGLNLSIVVKDAAKGIEAGVRQAFPDAEQRDDCFHALYEMNKVGRRLEQKAYAAIAREQEAEHRLGQIRLAEAEKRRAQKRELSQARLHCQEAITRFDLFERAAELVREAMEYVDLETGELRTGQDVQDRLERAAQILADIDAHHGRKLAGYLRNRAPGLSLATAALNGQLQELGGAYPAWAVALTCMIWRLVAELEKGPRYTKKRDLSRQLAGALALLQSGLGEKSDAILGQVKALLDRRYRASSAIEGFNAALRPYLYVHKGVSQSFLELFRFYYNLRIRRWGKNKGTSAHQCLTGKAVDDWLSLLGYPPSATLH